MNHPKAQRVFFTERLMDWHGNENSRTLPWKQEKDPYKIWLSEVILQQTRAGQGLPYYLRFVEHYPTVQELATAPEAEVFRLWQGLGYYNRCKNLLATARHIADNQNGIFPDSYEAIIALKGIGSYTAAAIASFAYGLPYAVVDGNVNRVLSRYFGIEQAVDTTEGKRHIQALAGLLIDSSDPAGYNQAIMDLGATVCKPSLPDCDNCPLQKKCIASRKGLTAELPVKSKKLTVTKRYFHYLLLIREDRLWIHKRMQKDIWENLYQPFLIEHSHLLDGQELKKQPLVKELRIGGDLRFEGLQKQRLTHQLIETRFYSAQVNSNFRPPANAGEWVQFSALKKFPFPKTLVSFLEKKVYF
jgi:A/G-specific adenine glycosylase